MKRELEGDIRRLVKEAKSRNGDIKSKLVFA